MIARRDCKPWYREPWPWILMAGPAIVVVAGVVTTAMAITSFDGLVADDYYKQGLGIDRALARDERARELGVTAVIQFNASRDRVRVMLASDNPPSSLRLAFFGARPSDDRAVPLAKIASGVYEGRFELPRDGAWRVRLDDGAGTWRLAGAWRTAQAAITLRPPPR